MNKVDFSVFISVKNANPNGDPNFGNRPREDFFGYGEIEDVCIKRKMRNFLLQDGHNILAQAEDNTNDEFKSIKDRLEGTFSKSIYKDDHVVDKICKQWIDVRAFGVVIAYKVEKNDKKGISIGVRGPVTINLGESVDLINTSESTITKSYNSKTGDEKGSDTIGTKHRIKFAVYRIDGSINPYIAQKTGFADDDSELIKKSLIHMFDNDVSAARPAGSMTVEKLIWCEHVDGVKYSSNKVFDSIDIFKDVDHPKKFSDYTVEVNELDELKYEICEP